MRRPLRIFRATAERKQAKQTLTASRASKSGFPIVGVGASAGGLEAFTKLLENLPIDSGMAFVLVQHMDPEHESGLARILAKSTRMPVFEVGHNTQVLPNFVYVIPPNKTMVITRGVLKLLPRPKAPGLHRSVDFFFESLGQDQRERAIGIVLSGAATDGTQGLEIIKAEGGITFAQDDSAKCDSMPRSAVAAGCVDLILSPAEIARELGRIARHPLVAAARKKSGPRSSEEPLPARELSMHQSDEAGPLALDQAAFKKILQSLHNHRGVDFSLYKPNTIHRRVMRRMVLNKHDSLGDYASFLKGNTNELELLYGDVLISVTSFFRNPEAFESLKKSVFPALVRDRRPDEPVRVWTLGCSTGQEAYSIAMAYTEFCDKRSGAPKLQIFATDLNDPLLEKARHGLYAKGVVADISAERLRRFFVEEQSGYRVCKSIRDLCVFARQNVLSDPPFSRMDLVSCRNMLIYIELALQKRILTNFHYALKAGGFLFMGASESIGTFTNLFEAVDRKQKIFSKKSGPAPTYHLPVSRISASERKPTAGRRGEKPEAGFRSELDAQREADRIMVHRFAPPSVLINSRLEVVQFRGLTSLFLEPPAGKASFHILKMARAGLTSPLRVLISEAVKKGVSATRKNVRLDDAGRSRLVNLEVLPLKNLKERSFLILFELVQKGAASTLSQPLNDPPAHRSSANSRTVRELERDLAEARDYAQSLEEQHQAASQDLQASHEEVQSANEELQSTNEELETSKEELESANEELITVNEEMTSQNNELSRLNGDLTNLQTSTRFPIVLLGADGSIRRFSPQAEKQFNLLATDIGRPFSNVRHNLKIADLDAFISTVIDGGRERECEVQDKLGHWHLLHVRPYLTMDNRQEGAVLVLVDIDVIKETEKAVVAARDFADAIIRTARDPLLILDADLRVERANESFYATFKVSPEESVGRTVFELDHGHWNIPKLRELIEDILPRHSFFNNFEVTHDFENIGVRTMLLNARTLSESAKSPGRILLGIQDVTEQLHFQVQMRRSELRYRRLFESSQDGVLIIDPDTRKILDSNPFMTELLGYPHADLIGKELFEIGLLKDEKASQTAFEELQKNKFIRYENLPLESKSGQRREVEFVSNLYHEGEDRVIQCNIRDVTQRKLAQRELSEKARLLDLSNDAIIVRDFEGRILYWNHGAQELYGWTREEAIGSISNTLLQTEYPMPLEQITEELRRNNRWTGELVHTTRDGRRLTVLARKALDRDAQGRPAAVLQTLTDITERKMSERLLSEKARLLDLSNDAIIVRDLNDKITLWNKGAEKLYGWTSQEATGTHLNSFLETEFPKPLEEILAQVQREGQFTGEVVQVARDGRRVPSLSRWVLDPDTESILTSYTDITERTVAEEALRQSEERYRSLFNCIDEGFCVIELIHDSGGLPVDYRFIETNPCFQTQAGFDPTGRTMLEIAPDHEPFWFTTFGRVLTTGEPVRFVHEASALKRWFDVYAFRVGGLSRERVAILFRDITHRKQADKKLEDTAFKLSGRADGLEKVVAQRTVKLQETVGELQTLTYTIAHNLRAPLRAINGMCEALVEDSAPNLDATGKDHAQRAAVAAVRMDALIGDLLLYGRLVQTDLRLVPIDLKKIAEEVVGRFAIAHSTENLALTVKISGDLPFVHADARTLALVIEHLLDNALKFSKETEVPVIEVAAEFTGTHIRLTVKDQGTGIALEHQKRIFSVFERLVADDCPGTGIGLAMVKKAMHLMGGSCGVESTLNEGSTFWIDLTKAQ